MKKNIPQYYHDEIWKIKIEEEERIVTTMRAFEEYATYTLYYPFNIGSKHFHEHDFYSVLKWVFNYPISFNLKEDDKEFYTKRQLSFIKKLINQCQTDSLKDISNFNKTEEIINKEEYLKRNYKVE